MLPKSRLWFVEVVEDRLEEMDNFVGIEIDLEKGYIDSVDRNSDCMH